MTVFVGARGCQFPRLGASITPPASTSRLTPRLGAMQHANATWLTSATTGATRRAIAARYDWIQAAIGPGVSSVGTYFDEIRGVNSDVLISNYTQVWEVYAYGIYSITSLGGNVWLVTLDGTAESAPTAATSTGTFTSPIVIGNCTNTAFNGTHAYTNEAVDVNGRMSFRITVTGGSEETGSASRGAVLNSSDARLARFQRVCENDWFLRNTSGNLISSGVASAQRAINYIDTSTANGDGDRWPEVKAQHDLEELFPASYQPTVGDPLIVWVDNCNYRARTSSGVWGGSLGSGAITSTNTTLASKIRAGTIAFFQATRALQPTAKIVGNFDSDVTGASAKTLNYTEYASNGPDGCFKEGVYDGDSTGGNEYARNDTWLTLKTKFNDERSRIADVTLHTIHCQGGGASNAAEHQDYRTATISLAACLILTGNTMAETTVLSFGAQTHDVTIDPYWHTCFSAELGDPIDSVQTAPRSGKTHIFARFFDNGVVVANPNTTSESFSDADLTSWQPAAHTGKTYRRLGIADNPYESSEVNPDNTGAAFSGSKSLNVSAIVLLLDE